MASIIRQALPLLPLPNVLVLQLLGNVVLVVLVVFVKSVGVIFVAVAAVLQRRKLNLNAEVESSTSQFSSKRLVPGGFNLGFIGSTCTGLPYPPALVPLRAPVYPRDGRDVK